MDRLSCRVKPWSDDAFYNIMATVQSRIFSNSKLSSHLGRKEVLSAFASYSHSLSLACRVRVSFKVSHQILVTSLMSAYELAFCHLLFDTGEHCWSSVAHGLNLWGHPCFLGKYIFAVRARILLLRFGLLEALSGQLCFSLSTGLCRDLL